MGSRKALDDKLRSILGSNNVYFQPDYNVNMRYPCIVYQLTEPFTVNASDETYHYRKHYTMTVIFTDPDSDLSERIVKAFRMCRHNGTRFVSDNLYHDPLSLYY